MIAFRPVSRVALALALAAFTAAAFSLLPAPTWGLWLVHLVTLETSLATTLVSLLALVIVRRAPRGEPQARAARGLALTAALAGLVPFAAAAPLYVGRRVRFSILEYVRGFQAPIATVDRGVEVTPSRLRADLYHPAGHGPHPLVVVVHGGSWQHGDTGEAPELSAVLAGAGYVVADVQYRLGPGHRFPDAIGDVKCALGRLRERAADLDLDPRRAALLGRSAGGQIALVAAYSNGDRRVPPSCAVAEAPVGAVVSLYAPTDLAWGHDNPLVPDPIDGPAAIEAYLGGPPRAQADAYRLASPLTWAERPLPPTLLVHGAADRLVRVEHARRLAAGLSAAGQPVETLLVPMADHGFDRRFGGLGEQLARAAILEFLGRRLGR